MPEFADCPVTSPAKNPPTALTLAPTRLLTAAPINKKIDSQNLCDKTTILKNSVLYVYL